MNNFTNVMCPDSGRRCMETYNRHNHLTVFCLSLIDAQFQPCPINVILRTLQAKNTIVQLLVNVVSWFPQNASPSEPSNTASCDPVV